MLGKKTHTPSVITAGLLVVGVLAALMSLLHKHSNTFPPSTRGRPVHYMLTILAQEEAVPGKVVRAGDQRRLLAEYVCQKDDIAVAVIALDQESGRPFVHTDMGPATGRDGKIYPVSLRVVNNIYFVTLKRGQRQPPPRITVPLLFYSTSGSAKMGVTNLNVTFTKIAAMPNLGKVQPQMNSHKDLQDSHR